MRPVRTASTLLLLAGTLCAAVPSPGGTPDTSAAPRCSLTLRTGSDTAWVFIDSVRTGKTPLTADSLRGGRHLIRLVQADVNSWLTDCIIDTIDLAPGEQRILQYTFDRRVMVVTDPSGAIVYMGDSAAGTTPLLLVSRSADLPAAVRVERRGYEKTIIPLPHGNTGVVRVELNKIWQSEPSETPLMAESGSADRSGVRLYVAGGITLAAGIAAAYWKIKADGKNALYQNTGDPGFQRETHRLDTSAAVALLATEIGFAFFSYYLLSN